MLFTDANLADECIDPSKGVDIEGLIQLASKMTPHKRDENIIKQEMFEFIIDIVNMQCGGNTEADAIRNWEHWLETYGYKVRNECSKSK